jgi:hypothetical protein
MPDVTLQISSVNDSLSIGDVVYYAPSSVVGGFNTTINENNIVKMGECKAINSSNVVIDHSNAVPVPSIGDFVFFSKNNSVNLSSITGYFAEARFVNNSTEQAELFSVNVGVEQSSK